MEKNKKVLIQRVSLGEIYGFAPETELDVLINEEGLIEKAEQGIKVSASQKIIDASGFFLSPGWVDMHTHCYWGANNLSVLPESIGLISGVTTLVDAGTVGEASFPGFKKFIVQQSKEKIFSFLNFSSFGLTAVDLASEFVAGRRSFNLKRTQKLIEENSEIIRGIKIRCSGSVTQEFGISFLKIAKKLAQVNSLPLMVHIGEAPPIPEEILDCLGVGDLVTHCFHGKTTNNIAIDDSTIKKVESCKKKGVLFDVGHGYASFSSEVCSKMIKAGFLPDTISSDLHQRSIKQFVYDLPLVMSKLLALGMPFYQILQAVTRTPRKILQLPIYDKIIPGNPADFTIFKMINKKMNLQDSQGSILKVNQIFCPVYTFLKKHCTRSSTYLEKNTPKIIKHTNAF